MALLAKTIEPPKRYRSSMQKILMDLAYQPIHLKEKCVRRKKTMAEKKADKEKCQTKCKEYLDACEAAWEVINEEAWKLHAQFENNGGDRLKAHELSAAVKQK
ncbi:hypothetical protein C0995_014428 [Termitomyces sp. Mi166|nr:hypothetical protein C0995_014428 [Termitomyces sp. Mi166\